MGSVVNGITVYVRLDSNDGELKSTTSPELCNLEYYKECRISNTSPKSSSNMISKKFDTEEYVCERVCAFIQIDKKDGSPTECENHTDEECKSARVVYAYVPMKWRMPFADMNIGTNALIMFENNDAKCKLITPTNKGALGAVIPLNSNGLPGRRLIV